MIRSVASALVAFGLACIPSGSRAIEPPAERVGSIPRGLYPDANLMIPGDASRVLLTIDGEPALTTGEFNELFRDFPVENSGQSLESARRQVLEQLATYKLIVREAHKRFPPPADSPGAKTSSIRTDRMLANALIRQEVANPESVSNEEAQRYLRERDDSSPASEVGAFQLLNAKIALLNARWEKTLESWRSQSEIEISSSLTRNPRPQGLP